MTVHAKIFLVQNQPSYAGPAPVLETTADPPKIAATRTGPRDAHAGIGRTRPPN